MINLKGKKVAVLGYGVEGKSTTRFLLVKKANVTVLDINPKVKDKTQGLKWQLGENYLENLDKFEMIVRSPGVPYLTAEIQKAKKRGVKITSATKLFFQECPAKIIGVTGTKGKGTTVSLIYAALKESGKKVHLLGNIGQPMLEALSKIKKDDLVVLELSSFQLQDLDKSPHIAVVLDITQDHLDAHRTKKEYIEAKYNIVRHQTKNDFAVINADYLTSFEFGAQTSAQTFFFSRRKLVDQGAYVHFVNRAFGEIILKIDKKKITIVKTYDIHLRGLHNLENICAATATSYLAGADPKSISKVITTFKGLPHRLEFVSEIGGVKYYNDSASTTPETAIAALRSFSEPIILIAGGSQKYADFKKLGEEIDQKVKAVILIGQEAKSIKAAILKAESFRKDQLKIITGLKNMPEIIDTVNTIVSPGDVVLLSPACASFDMFRNYQDRGEQFRKEVNDRAT